MRQKYFRLSIIVVVMAVIFASVAPTLAARPGGPSVPTITLLNAPHNGEIHIHVGESYALTWHVESTAAFQSATVLADQFYPGRGIFFSGTDRSGAGTSADISLALKGKEPTEDLAEGYAPISPTVVVRFGGGADPYYQTFELKIYVTP